MKDGYERANRLLREISKAIKWDMTGYHELENIIKISRWAKKTYGSNNELIKNDLESLKNEKLINYSSHKKDMIDEIGGLVSEDNIMKWRIRLLKDGYDRVSDNIWRSALKNQPATVIQIVANFISFVIRLCIGHFTQFIKIILDFFH